ncbi:MAG TPA: carboxypeptidase-like regulatory domain-containing protein [Candidatus Binatia bacterium]|nr:carboxypeptidase-like regulatory domain-containing protein [Candidatus Binatia bacterium]
MIRSRFVFFVAFATLLAGCGDYGVPPSQTYATVQGVITDGDTNQPIGGATVTVDSVLTTSTTADGAFKFTNVPIGPFDYSVTATGYQQTTGEGTAAAGPPQTLNLQMGK